MNNTGVEHLKKKGKMLASGKEKKRIIKKWFSTYRGRVSKDSFQSTKVGTRLEEWMPESSIWKKKKGKVVRIWEREKEDREEMIFNLSRTSFVIPLSSKNPLKSKLNNECRRNEEWASEKKKGKMLRIWKREKKDREETIFNLSRSFERFLPIH